jgi:hypothetical protein
LEVGPPLQFFCLGHNVLAEQDADLESNLMLLARKKSPAYHDDAPQHCRVCGIFSIVYSAWEMDDFCHFFSPAISPRQKF